MKIPLTHSFPEGSVWLFSYHDNTGGVIVRDPKYDEQLDTVTGFRVSVDSCDRDGDYPLVIDMIDVRSIELIGPEKLAYITQTTTDQLSSRRIQIRAQFEQDRQMAEQSGLIPKQHPYDGKGSGNPHISAPGS